ncbi:hypothetical protein [Kitasatospora sp. GP82]|uniref:hypothetical protein n=1 Tax=Kitasatospora sp. GP82 TaxID=3035089 RepID=UPI00247DA5D9|nr:hypothetical protein [Kitasatospora sp. GP82]
MQSSLSGSPGSQQMPTGAEQRRLGLGPPDHVQDDGTPLRVVQPLVHLAHQPGGAFKTVLPGHRQPGLGELGRDLGGAVQIGGGEGAGVAEPCGDSGQLAGLLDVQRDQVDQVDMVPVLGQPGGVDSGADTARPRTREGGIPAEARGRAAFGVSRGCCS